MAASTREAEVAFVVQSLKRSVLHNADFISGLDEIVRKLCRGLDLLKAFYIKLYAERQISDDFLEDLASKIRTTIYRAEDAVEVSIVLGYEQKSKGTFARAFNIIDSLVQRHYCAQEMDILGKEIQDMLQQFLKLGPLPPKIERIPHRANPTRVNDLTDTVVGFEDEVENIMRLLLIKSDELEVVSIIGMTGIGKTTLARKVFASPNIEYKFYSRVFVNVCQEYTRREVFLEILGQLTTVSDHLVNISDQWLVEMIRNMLGRQKYLIVLDDVWTREAWDNIKSAFPNNKRGSRILITSRNGDVAAYSEPYHVRFLRQEESRELLRKDVFPDSRFPPELLEYEDTILQECQGLPMGIKLIAGMLRENRDKIDWWKEVADGLLYKSIERDMTQSLQIIRESFNQLPFHLKPCFLYLGVFKDSVDIPVWNILQLWIAEGLIQQREGYTSLEDVAEDYLEDLVSRNLVMVGQRKYNAQLKTCRIPNIYRDFCIHLAEKENFFQRISWPSYRSSNSDNWRRICIISDPSEFIKSPPPINYLRSLLSFAHKENSSPLGRMTSIPKAFKLLRVLDIRPVTFTHFPTDLFYLVLLKYLAICCNAQIIPEKLANLRNLQTLIVETSSATLEIKADIWKMRQLRHLRTMRPTFLRKVREYSSTNKNLQTLSLISPESCKKEVFDRTPNLKKLGISGNLDSMEFRDKSILFDSVVKLKFLEKLKIWNTSERYRLHILPRGNKFPRKLESLTLSNTSLCWEGMSTLGKLENLQVLKLKKHEFAGDAWRTEGGCFRRLKVLHISDSNLRLWNASADNFPLLESLILRHCPKLEAIPCHLAYLPGLLKIDLYRTNSVVVSSARKIQIFRLQAMENTAGNSGFKLNVYPPDM